jgi:hypothetical protein
LFFAPHMSAFGGRADVAIAPRNVRTMGIQKTLLN